MSCGQEDDRNSGIIGQAARYPEGLIYLPLEAPTRQVKIRIRGQRTPSTRKNDPAPQLIADHCGPSPETLPFSPHHMRENYTRPPPVHGRIHDYSMDL